MIIGQKRRDESRMTIENIVNNQQALNFVNRYGCVTLFPIKGLTFPSLYKAVFGKDKEEKFKKTWSLADYMAQEKKIHYGKLVKNQVTLISLEMFPYFYRIHRREQFRGTPRRILDFLKQHGPTSTTNLRKGLNLMGRESKSEFTKAMNQLQEAFAIAIVDRQKSPKMLYTWNLLKLWMPKDTLKKGETISEKTAKERISAKLQENKVIDKAEEVGKLLNWK